MRLFFDYRIILLIFVGTLFIVLFVLRRVKDYRMKVAVVLSAISIFIYSGVGISMPAVKNGYVSMYLIALFFFYLPFILIGGRKRHTFINHFKRSPLDSYLFSHVRFLIVATIIYFCILILPMLFPRFRLLDIFIRGITLEGIYDVVNEAASSPFFRLLSMLRVFVLPFFYAYIMLLRVTKPNSSWPYILFFSDILLNIMDVCYISRSAMVYDFFIFYFLAFCIKDGEFIISKKQVIIIASVIAASIPFMYAFTFFRLGMTADTLGYRDSLELLMYSECTYPEYYDHILSSSELQGINPLSIVLWLICLPIPSVLWPSKPTLANDVFTHSITGLYKTDLGYSSLLPSFLGESFMYFGGTFYWIYTFMAGLVFALIIKYLSRHKLMLIFIFYLIMQLTAVGRVGPTVAIPRFINGTLFVFLIDWFIVSKNRKVR